MPTLGYTSMSQTKASSGLSFVPVAALPGEHVIRTPSPPGGSQPSASLAGRVRARRRHTQLTQADLAGRAGLSVSTICRVEAGRSPSADSIARIAVAPGSNVVELTHGTTEETQTHVETLEKEALEIARNWCTLRESLRNLVRETVVALAGIRAEVEASDRPTKKTKHPG